MADTQNDRSICHAWCNVLHAKNHFLAIANSELDEKLICFEWRHPENSGIVNTSLQHPSAV